MIEKIYTGFKNNVNYTQENKKTAQNKMLAKPGCKNIAFGPVYQQSSIGISFQGKKNDRGNFINSIKARLCCLEAGHNKYLSFNEEERQNMKKLIPSGKEAIEGYQAILARYQGCRTDENFRQIMKDIVDYEPKFFEGFDYSIFANEIVWRIFAFNQGGEGIKTNREFLSGIIKNENADINDKKFWIQHFSMDSSLEKRGEFLENFEKYAKNRDSKEATEALMWLHGITQAKYSVLHGIENSKVPPKIYNSLLMMIQSDKDKKAFDDIAAIIKDNAGLAKYIQDILNLVSIYEISTIRDEIAKNDISDAKKEAMGIFAQKNKADNPFKNNNFMGLSQMYGCSTYLDRIDENNISQLRELANERKCGFWDIYNFTYSCLDKNSSTMRFKLYPGQKEAVFRHLTHATKPYTDDAPPSISQSCVVKDENGGYYFDGKRFEKGMLVFSALMQLGERMGWRLYESTNYVKELCENNFDFKNNTHTLNSRLPEIYKEIEEKARFEIEKMNYFGNVSLISELLNGIESALQTNY